jgi:hypothetical protein
MIGSALPYRSWLSSRWIHGPIGMHPKTSLATIGRIGYEFLS